MRLLFRCIPVAILVSAFLLACSPASREIKLTLPADEQPPAPRQLLHYPPEGYPAGVNPPGFYWRAHPDALGYRFLLFRDGSGTPLAVHDSLRSTATVLNDPLQTGDYKWYVAYLDSSGTPFARSEVRWFSVGREAPELPMPDLEQLTRLLDGRRPRLFFRPDGGFVSEVRRQVEQERIPLWERSRTLADAALTEPLYPEPAPYKDGVFEVGEWRRIYTPGKRGSAHVLRLALAWKVTGERKYLDGARKWLLHLAGWDPDGTTSYNLTLPDGSEGNDEAGMPILERMALAYDWIADELSHEDKVQVLASLRRRGQQVLEHYREVDFLSAPWSNHDVRVLAFLGMAAVSCLGEFPEAEQWLDYVLRSYLSTFPTWGSDDGGWAQGLSYWSAYVGWHTNFLDGLRSATGINLYRKPFFRNNGYFAVYFHPPYATRGGFGDHGEAAPNLPEKLMLYKFAAALEDPVLLWQAENIEVPGGIESKLQVRDEDWSWYEWFVEDVFAVLCPPPAGFQPQAPTGLEDSRWLKDIGWVAMHSALGEAERDVWALFKSSRYGSFSHSHADQNSFQFNAWGRALLIDSGYYPWFGSPHHNLWTRQTKAHNAVLVNGRGQASSDMAAAGTITQYQPNGLVTFVTGDATAAYNAPMNDFTVEQWQELLDEPLPPAGPEVRAARRTLAFRGEAQERNLELRGEPGRPWLAVHDYLAAAEPTTFQFMLHALERMEYDSKQGTVFVDNGPVRCVVRIIASQPLEFSQTDKFNVPPGERYEGAANQWHLTVSTAGKALEAKFLAIMVPFRSTEPAPRIELVEDGSWRGFEVNGEKVTAWWGEGETGTDLPATAKAAPARIQVDLGEDVQAQYRRYDCK
ncbi:MAG: DUF4962 domain-containing protein [Candidatus Glassbacteria bacterium]|nr:DUF4962 domain-containing protein [Candidatus Glassbacteria bacterium]